METQVIKIDDENLVSSAKLAAGYLNRGEIVAIPTETVYGLAANAYDNAAVSRIFEVKGRPQDNPIILHISDYVMLGSIAETISDDAAALAKRFWPGPLTLVFNKTDAVSDIVSCSLPTVAVRMPSHPVAAEVIKQAGVPLAAPSANLSGKPSTTSAKHVFHDLDGKVPLILDAGNSQIGVESTVLSLTGDAPVLLRPGFISIEEIREVVPAAKISKGVFEEVPAGQAVESPGLMHKHYAPNAAVVIVNGPLEQFAAYAQAQSGDGVFAMCFDGEETQIGIPSVAYGEKGDGESLARRVFSVLRMLDEIGAKKIYVRGPAQSGVSLAVYNRLLRAAAFKVVEL